MNFRKKIVHKNILDKFKENLNIDKENKHKGYKINNMTQKAIGEHFPGHSQSNLKILIFEHVKKNYINY